MDFLQVFTDKANMLLGVATMALAYMTSETGMLFLFFLFLNVVDCIFGYMKAYKSGTIKSGKGTEGVIKKLSYWIIVGIAFMLSEYFVGIGHKIGVDLGFLTLFGWFVLSVYIINEITSIVENMVAFGIQVPEIFLKGLHAAKTAVDEAGNKVIPEEKQEGVNSED